MRTAKKAATKDLRHSDAHSLATSPIQKGDVFEGLADETSTRLIPLSAFVTVMGRAGITREDLTAAADALPPADDGLDQEGFEFVVPVGEARGGFKKMIDRAQTHPTLLTKHGRPVAAVVSADFYERAIEALENAADTEAVAAARAEMAGGAEPIPAARAGRAADE
ncbi:MAG: type II toxin-antitoxin system prevent-host-death family antitoxin [Janthinobacterium lividum]